MVSKFIEISPKKKDNFFFQICIKLLPIISIIFPTIHKFAIKKAFGDVVFLGISFGILPLGIQIIPILFQQEDVNNNSFINLLVNNY
jgi:hypothetical protein